MNLPRENFGKGMGGHQSGKMVKDEWLTPPKIVRALGEFDLDPCSPINRPWDTAKNHYTVNDDGLRRPWFGRVWLNPPYGPFTRDWLEKLVEHGNGIALVFARTETRTWFSWVWPKAHAILFLAGRLNFYHVNGTCGDSAGAPSALIAYGASNVKALIDSKIRGQLIPLIALP